MRGLPPFFGQGIGKVENIHLTMDPYTGVWKKRGGEAFWQTAPLMGHTPEQTLLELFGNSAAGSGSPRERAVAAIHALDNTAGRGHMSQREWELRRRQYQHWYDVLRNSFANV